jgi:hypothetical protein
MGMKRQTRRWAGGAYLAMGMVGSVAAVTGVVGSSRLLNLIRLQQQGKCDYLPCADDGTYYLVIGLAVIGVAGIALLATTFIHWFTSRA